MRRWIFSFHFCLSEGRNLSFMESLLPLTDYSRFVLFILSYSRLHGGLTGTHGGTHLYTFVKITLVMVHERAFVQHVWDKVGSCTSLVRPQWVNPATKLTVIRLKGQHTVEETQRLPHMSRNKTSSAQNTHLSCLPVSPQLLLVPTIAWSPPGVSARLIRLQRSAAPPPCSRALALNHIDCWR